MNTLKTIYDKIGKTELAKHEIELSLADNLIKFYKDNLANNAKASSRVDTLLMETKIALNMYKEVQGATNFLLGDISKYEIKAKELGLDLPKEISNIIGMSKADQKNHIKIVNGLTKAVQGLDSANSL